MNEERGLVRGRDGIRTVHPDGVPIPSRLEDFHTSDTPEILELIRSTDRLIDSTRRLSRAQKGQWSQVLELRKAKGILNKDKPLEGGYWDINGEVCVDLETGELMDEDSITDDEVASNFGPMPARSEQVLRLLVRPEWLDASAIVEELSRN